MWTTGWLCIVVVVSATKGLQFMLQTDNTNTSSVITESENSTVNPVLVLTDNGLSDSREATETQQATCQVVTEKLVASASATVTHALKGVCATKDLQKHFLDLKNEINNKLEAINTAFSAVNEQMAKIQQSLNHKINDKQLERLTKLTDVTRGPRDYEITHQNYTLREDPFGNKFFSYFWKIETIKSKLSQCHQQVTIRSPSFYINRGYRMYIKIFPHQGRKNVYIHVGLTHGEYDDTLEWPFRLKHRVTILDQSIEGAEDISSRLWDPKSLCGSSDWHMPAKFRDNDDCVGFGLTQGAIFSRNYIFNDSIIIKLNVFVP